MDLIDRTDLGIETVTSVYAIYHRRNLLYITVRGRDDYALQVAGVQRRVNFPAEESAIEHCKDLVKGIRNVRTEMDVPTSRKAKLYITSEDAGLRTVFEENKEVYVNLASTSEIIVQADKNGISEDAVSVVIPGAVLYLPLEDLVDFEKEKERLHKEKDKLTKELARSKGMLSNEKFLNNAKPEKVQEEKDKLAKYEQMMAQVEARLAQMK